MKKQMKMVLLITLIFLSGCAMKSMQNPYTDDDLINLHYAQNDPIGSLLHKALTALHKQKHDQAEIYLLRAVRIAPNAPLVYYQMALLKIAQNNNNEARQMLLRALSMNPDKITQQAIIKLMQKLKSMSAQVI